MKTTSLFFAAFSILPAVLGAAVPSEKALEQRASGTTTIVNAVKSVNAAVNTLDKAVRNVTSADLTNLLAVNTQATALSDTLNTQKAKVQAAPNLDLLGAVAVEVVALQLVHSVQTLSKDLIKIKPYVVEAGVTSVVLSTVQTQKTNADSFADVLISKVPELVQFIAEANKKDIDDALNKVIKAYSS